MKASRIIAGLLIMLGFGGCANRAAKSRGADRQPAQTEAKADSADMTAPIRVMYGPPARKFKPVLRERGAQREQAADSLHRSERPAGESGE